MRNDVTGKTVAVGIALIFVFGAFIPAVGSEVKTVVNGQSVDKSEETDVYLPVQKDNYGQSIDQVPEFPDSAPLDVRGSSLSYFNHSATDDSNSGQSSQTLTYRGEVFYSGWYNKSSNYSELVSWYLNLEQNYSDYMEVFKANEMYGTGTVPDMDYDLYYVRITNESTGFHKPEVFFSGSPHGDETVGTNGLYWFADWLMRHAFHSDYDCPEREWLNWLLDNREIYICVSHNPWGFDNGTRNDFNNIDLNRKADHHNTWNPPWASVNGRTLRKFVDNHTLRVGLWFHDGMRAILSPWVSQHVGVVGVSPISGASYEPATPDFYSYDAACLRLGDYIGDYGGDLNSNNIGPSGTISGISGSSGYIPHWAYAADVEKNPAEDPYVKDEMYGNYPGTGLFGLDPEVCGTNKDPPESQFGNDTTHRFGAEIRRYILYCTDIAQPYLRWLPETPENNTVEPAETLTFNWEVDGCLVVDHTYIQWGTNPDPINNPEFATTDHDEHAGDYYGGTGWDDTENGIISGTSYSEDITFDTAGDYYFVAKAMVDQVYANVLAPWEYGNNSYLRLIKERTNVSYHEELDGTDGLEVIDGQLWWYSPVIHVTITNYTQDIVTSFFNWSSTEDWRNGTSSQVYIRDGEVGIGGYDDFEDYSAGPLGGDWEERMTSGWWTFYDNSGDMCIKHEGAVDDTRSMAVTDQWGNVVNSTIIVKGINVGDDAMLHICSRVNWSKNTHSGNCDLYGCRNDLRGDTQILAAFEMDDGSFSILYPVRSGEEGTVYQKLRTVTSEDGSSIVLSAKVWNVSDIEPEWNHLINPVNRTKLMHDGGDTGCFGFYGYSDDVFYISDIWLVGGWDSGNHATEWKNADQSVNWSKFRYFASGVSSGNQGIAITVQVSNDGLIVLDSMSFYANNGENEVDISSLSPAQYVRVITDFTTTDETKTAAVSSYSIEFQSLSLEISVSNPYPSDGATGIPVAPTLHIDVNSSYNYQMNITWKYYEAGHWYTFGNNNSVSNGTYYQLFSFANSYNTLYEWKVEVNDGYGNWRNKTYLFTTLSEAPVILNPSPADGATGISASLSELSFALIDYEDDTMNYTVIMVPDFIGGPQSGTDIGNGTIVHINLTELLYYDYTYTWQVHVTDGKEWTNETYSFTTEYVAPEFPIKWSSDIGRIYRGSRTVDLDGDGVKDVVSSADGGIRALNGIDGSELWYCPIEGVYFDVQIDVGDLNNDGIPEVVAPVYEPGGLCAVHGNNGSLYWNISNFGGSGGHQSGPLILDYDNDGYAHVYSATRGSGAQVYKVSYDGQIEASQPITHLCAGGICAMDYDNDGHFEIYFGDSDSLHNLESYYAENLTVRFKAHYPPETGYHYSQAAGMPCLVDCNNDGMRDILVHLGAYDGGNSAGVAILSAEDGSIIRADHNITGWSEYRWLYNLPVYDIDLDGNPEVIISSNHFLVFDLIDWTMDFCINTSGDLRWQPTIADVTGDGYMDIVFGRSDNIRVYDKNFVQVARIPESGSLPGEGNIIYPHVTDLDADGLNEIILTRTDGTVVVIETNGRARYGGSRAGEKGYGIYRQCVSEYVSILGFKDEYPQRGSTNVSFNPTLSLNVSNWQDELMDITFRTNASGTWQDIGCYHAVGDGVYNVSTSTIIDSNTRYWWSVNATDRKNTWTNMTYSFTTVALAPLVSNPYPKNGATYVPISLSTLDFNLMDVQGDKMNYTVETHPDIGNGSGVNVSDGRYSISVDNLSYSTLYIWYVNATDGIHYSNTTYCFTTEQEPITNPFAQGWQYRKKITIDHSKVTATLTNFPVLINITDADLATHAQSDGDDIIFMYSDGVPMQLRHEIEYYNSGDGTLVAWVNVTSLSNTTDTMLYMYYGNPDCNSYESSFNVWDSAYIMVQHLNETSGMHYDSTSNDNDGTSHGSTQDASGMIDGANSFDGSNDYVDCGNDESLDISDGVTVEAWVKRAGDGKGRLLGIVSRAEETGYNRYQLRYNSDDDEAQFFLGDSSTYKIVSSNSDIPLDAWMHLAATWNGSSMLLFVDGVQQTDTDTFTGSPTFASSILELGRYFNVNYFEGSIDEVRISDIVRSAGWILTEYNNQHSPSSFYDIGKEICFADLMLFDESPEDDSVDVVLNPVLSISAEDIQGDTMNIYFRTNASGILETIGSNLSVGNDTFYCDNTSLMNSYLTMYYWSVNATDPGGSGNWTNNTYSFTTRPENYLPVLSDPSPADEEIDVFIGSVSLSITVHDRDNDPMNITFCTNATGDWVDIGTNISQPNGTCSQVCMFGDYNRTYYWSVNCSDGKGWTNETYSFNTGSPPSIHVFTVDHESHMTYGLSYPVTYIFDIPHNAINLKAYKYGNTWTRIPTKNNNDSYSGVEAARFNYTEDKAYISASFANESDNIFIKITDENDNLIDATYNGIALYYDNSEAAVVLTCDDWYERYHEYFLTAIDRCQARNIWFTPGIVTVGSVVYGGQPANRTEMQQEVDEGFVEPASHSKYHLDIPYDEEQWGVQSSYDEEIGGSKQNILEDLTMPSLNRRGNEEYLYAWIEPYGSCDSTVRQKLGEYKYLCDRSTGSDTTFSSWDDTNGLYNRVGYAVSIDSTRTLSALNNIFNNVYSSGGIYHMFGHARNHDWISGDVEQHFDYISNRSDVWYAGFGHLYVYHYMQERNVITHSAVIGNLSPTLSSESPVDGATGVSVGDVVLQIYADDINGDLMNITFMTNASGVWQPIGSNNSVPSGMYQQSCMFPDYNTVYYWSVNATDHGGSGNWTNKTHHFTTRPENYFPVLTDPSPYDGASGIGVGDVTLCITVNDLDGDLMNITFCTNASGVWSDIETNSSQPNGTYSQVYMFNAYGHIYYWGVNCFDGTDWVNKTYGFSTEIEPITNPFAQGWQYRKKIIINHTKVVTTLTNFPVLINITDMDVAAHAQSDGDDIIFMDDEDVANQLHHEIEYYNSGDGTLVAWVNVTTLSDTTNTTLYMYYGNPNVVNLENASGVWDSGFVMIQHLDETSGMHYDSTSYGNDGTNHDSTQDAVGMIDGANSFDGSNDYVDCGNDESLDISDAVTLEAWVKRVSDGTGVYPGIVSRAVETGYNRYQLRYKPADDVVQFFLGSSSYDFISSDSDLPLDVWTHVVATWDGSSMLLFVDGVQQTDTGTYTSPPSFTSEVLELGRYTDINYFEGGIDEVRVSDIVRSAGWILTEYNNQYSPSSFYSISNEEIGIDAPILYDEYPQDGSVDIGLNPVLSIHAVDGQGDSMNIFFRTNAGGSWETIGSNLSVGNDTFYCDNTSDMNSYLTTYYWSVNATDPGGSGNWTNKTYSFTTRVENYLPVLSNPLPPDAATGISVGNVSLQITVNDIDGDYMNITFQTNASGVWTDIGTNSSQPNGTYSQIYTFNDDNHTYWWSVHCFDGKAWTNENYSFTTGEPPTIHLFTVDNASHDIYGLSYPVTYIFTIQSDATDLRAYKYVNTWTRIPNKNSSDSYSGIEAARFNYTEDKAYISVSFPAESDSVFIKITDENENTINATYHSIAQYYDDSKAVVVFTCDDWYERYHDYFMTLCDRCQARNIWLTPGIESIGSAVYQGQPANWTEMQQEVDEGFIEPASHSRNHLSLPYDLEQWGVQSSYDGEIGGSKQDILENLTMPSLNRRGEQEYLYAWIEPYGACDSVVRQKLGEYYYLCDRSTGSSNAFASWDAVNGVYNRVGYTISIESVRDLPTLNNAFNNVYSSGGIYHMFGHARNHDLVSGDVALHFDYISNRSDVWYAGFGHLYVYHYMEERNVITHSTNVDTNLPPALSSESPANGTTGSPVGEIVLQIHADDINDDMMNITFMTNASGVWQPIGSNTSVPSGTYEQIYTFPGYNITYWWSVNATDGSGDWTNNTYCFTTRPENYHPILSDPSPSDGALGIAVGDVTLGITVSDLDGDLMDITFCTNASGVWTDIGTNSSQPNGTYSQVYMFDAYGHIYYWGVNCFDGSAWVNRTYYFATDMEPITDPFAQGWQYRKKITIDHSKVAATLTNVPVLINITDADLATHAQSDGDDIIFMDDERGANQLHHEIEYYNSGDGTLVAWVNVTGLSNTINTTLYMYYGNPDVVNLENAGGVWDSGFVMVQHLDETSGTHYDSTSNDNDGTNHGSTQDAVGMIDGANDFDGSDDYVDCGNDASLDVNSAVTVEAWVRKTGSGLGSFQGIVSKAGSGTNRCQLRYNKDTAAQFFLGDSSEYKVVSSDSDLSLDVWTHLVATWDGSSMLLFVDGVQQTHTETFTGTPSFTSAIVELGRYTVTNCFEGGIDEIRVSDTAWSAGWILTEYNNQHSPSSFYSIGHQEGGPDEPILSDESPENGSVDVALAPVLSIHVVDSQDDSMNIFFRTNASGSWDEIGSNLSVNGGTFYCGNTSLMNSCLTTYYWSVNATDPLGSGNWTNMTYSFTTRAGNYLPELSNPLPSNGSVGIAVGNVTLSITVHDFDNDLMNITFCTNASGVWTDIDTNISQSDGTYIQIYVFNDYSTTYYWSVNCSDGKGWTNETFNFTTEVEPITDPFAQGWQYRKKITINHTKVADDLLNFPVLINITDADVAAHAQPDGDDIIFMDDEGVASLLHHEIELYDSGDGALVAWVNVTSLSSTENTTLYMYYGNLDCDGLENVSGVWGSSYMVIQHLNETTGMHYDSTSYDNDGTNYGSTQDAVGVIDGANSFDGSNDYVDCGNDESLDISDAVTLEAWVKRAGDGTGNYLGIVSRAVEGGGQYNRYQLRYKPADDVVQFFLGSSSYDFISSDSDLPLDVWTHVVGTWDGSNMLLFVDGVQQTDTGTYTSPPSFTSEVLELGRYTYQNYFEGGIDEVRVSDIARSADWILTEYNNQHGPSQFYNVGSEETAPSEDTIPPEIANVTATPSLTFVGSYVNISCDVTDTVGVDTIMVNITYPDLTYHNETMLGSYYYNNTFSPVGTYYYFIWANDTSGNANTSATYSFAIENPVAWDVSLNFAGQYGVEDTLAFGEAFDASDGQDSYDVPKPGAPPPSPYIYAWFDANLSVPYDRLWEDYRYYPDTHKTWDLYLKCNTSRPILGSANITISWNIEEVNVSEYGSGTFVLYNCENQDSVDMMLNSEYTLNATFDTEYHFQIICSIAPAEYHYMVSLSEGWNLISLPVNQSFHKDDITVNYLGVNSTWQQAVDNYTILQFIYQWDALIQNYGEFASVLSPGFGYWMYAYDNCDLWISSNISDNDNYITDLLVGWNLIGLPYDTLVAKENLTVFYNGTEYTWQQAVDNYTILQFIYQWDALMQNYGEFASVLSPGSGYWMYAYYNLILKKEAS